MPRSCRRVIRTHRKNWIELRVQLRPCIQEFVLHNAQSTATWWPGISTGAQRFGEIRRLPAAELPYSLFSQASALLGALGRTRGAVMPSRTSTQAFGTLNPFTSTFARSPRVSASRNSVVSVFVSPGINAKYPSS